MEAGSVSAYALLKSFRQSMAAYHPMTLPDDFSQSLFSFENTYQVYLKGLLSCDRDLCRASFQRWLDADGDLRNLYENLVQRSLYEVGELWERGLISVATEHMATALSESLLNLTYPRLFANPRTGKSAVVAACGSESHQLAAKMVADFFELEGWRGYFLGANTRASDLIDLIRGKHPDAVALSLTLYFNLHTLLETIAKIRAEFPDIPILVGGQGVRRDGRARLELLPGVCCLLSLSELEAWIHRFANNHV